MSLCAQGHVAPADFDVNGAIAYRHLLTWPDVDDQARRCWADLDEAVEHGAYGIAALLVSEHTELEVVERSRKGTGFDYWLGPKGQSGALFQQSARMEVSGIQKGPESGIRARLARKMAQTAPTDGVLPAYVVVVEFGTPQARVAAK